MKDSIIVVIRSEAVERFVELCKYFDVEIVAKQEHSPGLVAFVINAYPLYYWQLGRDYQRFIDSIGL